MSPDAEPSVRSRAASAASGGSRCGPKRRGAVRGPIFASFSLCAGVIRRSASGRPRRRGPQDGVADSRPSRQDEVAGERRAASELDHVAGVRAIERRLQIATGRNPDGGGPSAGGGTSTVAGRACTAALRNSANAEISWMALIRRVLSSARKRPQRPRPVSAVRVGGGDPRCGAYAAAGAPKLVSGGAAHGGAEPDQHGPDQYHGRFVTDRPWTGAVTATAGAAFTDVSSLADDDDPEALSRSPDHELSAP